MEKWINNGRYSISSNGRVIGPKSIILKPFLHDTGYLSYCHRFENKKRKTIAIHRIVAKLFVPNPYNKKEVNHKNGIKTDNRAENLEWCTRHENAKHSVLTGLSRVKIDRVGIMVMIEAYELRLWRQSDIAKYFNCHSSTVSDIVNKKTRTIWH